MIGRAQEATVSLADLALNVMRRILDRWEGQFVLSGPFQDGTAVARFSQPAAQKEACILYTLSCSPQLALASR